MKHVNALLAVLMSCGHTNGFGMWLQWRHSHSFLARLFALAIGCSICRFGQWVCRRSAVPQQHLVGCSPLSAEKHPHPRSTRRSVGRRPKSGPVLYPQSYNRRFERVYSIHWGVSGFPQEFPTPWKARWGRGMGPDLATAYPKFRLVFANPRQPCPLIRDGVVWPQAETTDTDV